MQRGRKSRIAARTSPARTEREAAEGRPWLCHEGRDARRVPVQRRASRRRRGPPRRRRRVTGRRRCAARGVVPHLGGNMDRRGGGGERCGPGSAALGVGPPALCVESASCVSGSSARRRPSGAGRRGPDTAPRGRRTGYQLHEARPRVREARPWTCARRRRRRELRLWIRGVRRRAHGARDALARSGGASPEPVSASALPGDDVASLRCAVEPAGTDRQQVTPPRRGLRRPSDTLHRIIDVRLRRRPGEIILGLHLRAGVAHGSRARCSARRPRGAIPARGPAAATRGSARGCKPAAPSRPRSYERPRRGGRAGCGRSRTRRR